MVHNMWYSSLGALQIGFWEVVFMHVWANNKIAFGPDSAATSSVKGCLVLVGWTIAMPILHDIHFYAIHRLLHVRVLYRYVHSLHHRNNDIEPFSGLCMHPVEHLFFFSILGINAILGFVSPWHFRWSLCWLVLAPGASHSGWEDHFNADQFHYLHHAKFECNYGSPFCCLDWVFGTMRLS